MEDENKTDTIRVKIKTKERFLKLGNLSETQDSVLNNLIDAYEKQNKTKAVKMNYFYLQYFFLTNE